MSVEQKVDLLIIGAGPAGLSTALHLLQKDPTWAQRMLLLEKAAHPRPKLCGGAITPFGLELLEDLGIELPLPISCACVDDVHFVYRSHTIHVRGNPYLVVFHRPELDAYLASRLREQGGAIHENETVQSISPQGDEVRVVTNQGVYRAQVVVGADGSKGITRQVVTGRAAPSRVARTLEVLQPARENVPLFTERYAVFDFTQVRDNLQGYFWDFPARVHNQPFFNRGVYDARMVAARPKAHMPPLLYQSLQQLGVKDAEVLLASHPIHRFSPRSPVSIPRLLLAGDTIGAEPLFGEGIAPALGYGEVAAQAVQDAFRRGDFSFRDYHRRVLRSRTGRYLFLRWAIAWVSYRASHHPSFIHFMFSTGDLLARLFYNPSPIYPPVMQKPAAGGEAQ